MTVSDPRMRRLVREAAGSAEKLFQLLVEGLDWPTPPDLVWSDVEVEWDPEELHLDRDKIATLHRISEIPPFTEGQDFGVFLLDFRGGRLPIGAVRRVVDSLVRKERSRKHGGTSPLWRMEDLLFFCLTSDAHRAIHVVGFREQDQKKVLRVMSWDTGMTETRLDLVMQRAMPELRWGDSRPALATDLSGFTGYRESIKSAASLANRMAEVAREVRSDLLDLFEVETDEGPMHVLFEEIRAELIADLTPERFADVYAQTMVYGLLTARIAHPEQFGDGKATALIEFENPLLDAFYARFRDSAQDEIDLDELGLADLTAQLAVSDIEAILADFGARNRRDDPVVYFYETFLSKYDPAARLRSGAFYTPLPVVRFQVQAVDRILKDTFGLPLGVADAGTWGDVVKHLGIDVPKGINPKARFVSMLDPATGTGTFLVEWIRQAERSFREVHPKGDWPAHLRDVVLPGMHAFELMLSSYAIAHLRIALAAKEYGVVAPALTILLTDSLDHPSDQVMLGTFDDPVAAEGERAAELKRSARFTVVLGNPPYEREQRTADEESVGAKRKGGVVRYGTEGVPSLLEDVIKPMRAARLGKHVKNLYNDYIYFWRYATWRTTERPKGPGIVSFITAASYLDGVSIGGLRSHLRDAFDELYIVDLGGEGRGARTEENVFDILTPVAIAVGVRTVGGSNCKVRYARVSGSRDDKFTWLETNDLDAVAAEVPGNRLSVLTPVSGAAYGAWPEVTQLFPLIFNGTKAGRTWVIGPSRRVLKERVRRLIVEPAKSRSALFKDSPSGRKAAEPAPRTSIMPGVLPTTSVSKMGEEPALAQYGYRSFDRQYIVKDPRFLDRAGPGWAVAGSQQVFLTTLTSTKLGRGQVVTATPYVPDLDHFRGSYGAKNVIPVWRDRRGAEPNLTAGAVEAVAGGLGQEVGVEDLVAYVYGLAGSGAFADHFADELGEQAGAVRIPITKDPGLFQRAVDLGRDLLWWHTWGERFGEPAEIDGSVEEVAPVTAIPESFGYDAESAEVWVGDGRFAPVSPEVWEFEVSGLKVLQSWLGNRTAKGKGRKSSPLDDIRPTKWTFTPELLQLLAILEHTVSVTPTAAELLDEVVKGPVFTSDELPQPTEAEQKPPRS